MELSNEVTEYINELETLKNDNKRLVARVQEQNSNIKLLAAKINIKEKEINNYKRLYENEKNERMRLLKIITEKQEKLNI